MDPKKLTYEPQNLPHFDLAFYIVQKIFQAAVTGSSTYNHNLLVN